MEVERDALRGEHEALEEKLTALQLEKDELAVLQASLATEREEIDKKAYEITTREYALEETQKSLDNRQTETDASSEEMQRRLEDLEIKETELMRNNQKLQDELSTLQQQQKDFATRQSIYNQQQLDFITRKNALAAQQFEMADKLAAYNSQVKLFNENLEKLEAEKAALISERSAYEEQLRVFEKRKADFDEDKTRFEQSREEANKKTMEEMATLQLRTNELHEREIALSHRENAFYNTTRDFNTRSQNNTFYGNSPYASPQPLNGRNGISYVDLREQANLEGIRLNTAGTMTTSETVQPTIITKQATYNLGATLFKSAFIIFCIIAFECLTVFFARDYLSVHIAYPIIGFSVGFAAFLTCAILYAYGYKPCVKRKKHPSYVVTVAIVFVITVIIVSMIAVYCKAKLSDPAELLSYVIIPIVYLMNALFFSLFYYTFSLRTPGIEKK